MGRLEKLILLRNHVIHPLKHLRIASGLTQAQLARRVGVTEQFVRRAELGLLGTTTDITPLFRLTIMAINDRQQLEGRKELATALLELRVEYINFAETSRLTEQLRCEIIDNTNTKTAMDLVKDLEKDYYTLIRFISKQIIGEFKYHDYGTVRDFIWDFNKQAGNEVTSIYAFCRSLGLHLFPVQRWHINNNYKKFDGRNKADWPADLYTALVEVGVDPSKVQANGS